MVSVSINENGLAEIQGFLATYHREGADNLTLSQLEDWAYAATLAHEETGVASIEIKAWDCVLGVSKELILDERGLDIESEPFKPS